MSIRGVIFDLDGVILSTDNLHYLAWKKMADRESIYFDRETNERLRGVSRMASLDIILERSEKEYSDEQKVEMATYKNDIYRDSLKELAPKDIYPGVGDFLDFLENKNIGIAIGSSSKNSKFILERVGLLERFSGRISDGTNISKSKPDPEVFIKAAAMLDIPAANCLVIEDADAGVEAAKRGNMLALGVGAAKGTDGCDYSADDISGIDKSIFN